MDIDASHEAEGEALAVGGAGAADAAARGGAPGGGVAVRAGAGDALDFESDDLADGLVKAAPGEEPPGRPQEVIRMRDGDRARFPDGRGAWHFGLLHGNPVPKDGMVCVLCGQGRK